MKQLLALVLLVFMVCLIMKIGTARPTVSQVTFLQQGPSSGQAERRELLFPSKTPENKMSGEFMKAFYIAFNKFVSDNRITDNHKQLVNYEIAFNQNKESYYVYFLPKSRPGELAGPGGATSLGRYVTYEVRKIDFQVTTTQFYK